MAERGQRPPFLGAFVVRTEGKLDVRIWSVFTRVVTRVRL